MSHYDFIIVGAGRAGCILADRLTASGRLRVLLLDAGSGGGSPWIRLRSRGWSHQTEPDTELRAKNLDAPSITHGLLHDRAQAEAYDAWEAAGNAGWGWRDVLPHLRRFEDRAHSVDIFDWITAPRNVADPTAPIPLSHAIVAAVEQAGLSRADTSDRPRQRGMETFQPPVRPDTRSAASVTYLNEARRRPNLVFLTHATAIAIVFAGHRAVAVRYRRHGRDAFAQAGQEVILSAGAIATPHLLQVSGVGPATHLRGLGIDVVADLPGVGAHLQNHIMVHIAHRVRARALNDTAPIRRLIREVRRHVVTRRGPPAIGAPHVNAYWRSDATMGRPDLQFQFQFLPAILDSNHRALSADAGMTCGVCQLRPESRGSILIASPDIREPPRIRSNALNTDLDRRVTLTGLRMARHVFAQSALDLVRGEEMRPGSAVASDDALLSYAQRACGTPDHLIGTCRMGPDPASVVDAELRIHGILGLRVVDASIMPGLIPGNTDAATIMIAERAADMLLRPSEAVMPSRPTQPAEARYATADAPPVTAWNKVVETSISAATPPATTVASARPADRW